MHASRTCEWLVLDLLRSDAQRLKFEEIIEKLPELTWNQVFLAVDSLSRRGDIVLTRQGFD
jgi:imidazoleglycerol phosphate synthase glutamine amidotransferase subunit HisH